MLISVVIALRLGSAEFVALRPPCCVVDPAIFEFKSKRLNARASWGKGSCIHIVQAQQHTTQQSKAQDQGRHPHRRALSRLEKEELSDSGANRSIDTNPRTNVVSSPFSPEFKHEQRGYLRFSP
ncbi:uncharacterized protein UDID_18325 [Ustilago sp. UG-2017a]|nr:uncharacterized protein UDID_18325 [Ustilago sp. UG-2017a]